MIIPYGRQVIIEKAVTMKRVFASVLFFSLDLQSLLGILLRCIEIQIARYIGNGDDQNRDNERNGCINAVGIAI